MHNSGKGLTGADWVLASVVIAIWGVNFVVMKWGLQEVSPLLLCALRFMAASLPFLLFVRPPRNLSWGVLAAYGLVQGVGQFGLLFVGMHLGMPAGMASVVLQTQAFITLLMAAVWLGERPQPLAMVGIVHCDCGLDHHWFGPRRGCGANDLDRFLVHGGCCGHVGGFQPDYTACGQKWPL